MGLLQCSQEYCQVLPQHPLPVSLLLEDPIFIQGLPLGLQGQPTPPWCQGIPWWWSLVWCKPSTTSHPVENMWFRSHTWNSRSPTKREQRSTKPNYSNSHSLLISPKAEQTESRRWCHPWAKADTEAALLGGSVVRALATHPRVWSSILGQGRVYLGGSSIPRPSQGGLQPRDVSLSHGCFSLPPPRFLAPTHFENQWGGKYPRVRINNNNNKSKKERQYRKHTWRNHSYK